MKLLRRWGKKRAKASRTLQEQLDVHVVATLTQLHDGEKSIEAAQQRAESEGFVGGRQLAAASVTRQLRELLQHVEREGGYDAYPEVEREGRLRAKSGRQRKEAPLIRKEVKHPSLPFSLVIRASSIADDEAGLGVFLEGECPAGTLLCLYPGPIYHPHDLTESITKGNEYILSRYDGTTIDGRDWDLEADIENELRSERIESGADVMANEDLVAERARVLCRYRNPFGIGNYINHPPLIEGATTEDEDGRLHPKAEMPNVIRFDYDCSIQEPELLHYLPNRDASTKTWTWGNIYDNGFPKTVAMIASRNIVDEELYFNYRFNPANAYPEWYGQPDYEEARRRWAKVDYFNLSSL